MKPISYYFKPTIQIPFVSEFVFPTKSTPICSPKPPYLHKLFENVNVTDEPTFVAQTGPERTVSYCKLASLAGENNTYIHTDLSEGVVGINLDPLLGSEGTVGVGSTTTHGEFGGYIDLSGTAVCTDCGERKSNSQFKFYKNRVNPTTKLCLYVNKKCKDCLKLYMVHKKLSEQNVRDQNIERPKPSINEPYLCDCCGKAILTTKTIQLDHCHENGMFRGWLCKECNISMGNLGDNIEGILRVIKYLNKTEGKTKEDLQHMIDDLF